MRAEVGFVKLQRSEWAAHLLDDMPAMHLFTVIALRARWSDASNPHGLGLRQAFLGDFADIGMTEKQYRGAKLRLARLGLVTFQSSHKGTIATICDDRVFAVTSGRADRQDQGGHEGGLNSEVKSAERADSGAAQRHPRDGRGATNEEGEKEKKEKKDKNSTHAPADADAGGVRDTLFEALAKSCDEGDPAELTAPAEKSVRVALAYIKRAHQDLTIAEIERRAANYRSHFPETRLTAPALAKHWARVAEQAQRRVCFGRRSSFADVRPSEFASAF